MTAPAPITNTRLAKRLNAIFTQQTFAFFLAPQSEVSRSTFRHPPDNALRFDIRARKSAGRYFLNSLSRNVTNDGRHTSISCCRPGYSWYS